MTKLTGIAAFALLASLGACGSADQPAEDTAPNAAMTMDGPYAESEMAMDKAMRDAVGVDDADTWVKKMIAHHEGAINMSRIALGLEPTANVAKTAQMTIEKQGAEIEALKALARNGAANSASARLYEAAMTEMHSDMMAASGATPSETYLTKMLAHHRGAVAMSDIALASGATGAVRAQIEQTRAKQLEEIALVEAMLKGEPTPATQTKNAVAAPTATAKPDATKTTAAKPAPVRAAAPKASPEPTAEADDAPTCAPEHRAAGHC